MTNNKASNGKLLYFVIGGQGSGKTVLSNQLANKIKGESEVFDDYHFHRQDASYQHKLISEVTKIRHTGKTIFINTLSPRFLHEKWNVKENPLVTWILTSLTLEDFTRLSETFSKKYMLKFFKAYRNVCERKRNYKTRPYLSITLNPNKTGLIYEYHRYKKQLSGDVK